VLAVAKSPSLLGLSLIAARLVLDCPQLSPRYSRVIYCVIPAFRDVFFAFKVPDDATALRGNDGWAPADTAFSEPS
jgi:hypothetical protein